MNKCTNNKRWDNTGNGAYIHDTDCRKEFCKGLREYWATHPYRLKAYKTTRPIIYNGLFGTGCGIQIRENTFPVYKKFNQLLLVMEYAETNNIPVVIKCRGNNMFVFATEKSAQSEKHLWSMR